MRELSLAEQRYQAVLAVISDGLSISQVAEKVGVSRQTLLSWLAHGPRGAGGPVASAGALSRQMTAPQDRG
jgi:transposase